MTQAELNISNLITWFILCAEDDECINPDSSDQPDWLPKEILFNGRN